MAGLLNFTAIDVVTANSNFSGSVCEVGVAVVKSGEIVVNWSQLINPQIEGEDARDAPTFNDIYPKIKGSVARGKIVSHGRFDENAIRQACERQGLPMLQNPWRDSLVLAKRAWPRESSHSLPKIAPKLEIRYNPHYAGEDARVVAALVLRAARVIGIKRVNDWLRGVKNF